MTRAPLTLALALLVAAPAFADDPPAAPGKQLAPETGSNQEVGSPPPPSATGTGFAFGSYGRVTLGSDAQGHEGYSTSVVSHGSRLEADPYLELDLYYGGAVPHSDGLWRVVLAPAFQGPLFHYTGNFTSELAIRNAYAETEGVLWKGLSVWAGSRMLRGDDIYLFNYWPLDNLNTVGAGASLRFGQALELRFHGGQNLLTDSQCNQGPCNFQSEPVPPLGAGIAGQAVTLDRPRSIFSFKATYRTETSNLEPDSTRGLKASLYGEYHYLPEGQRFFPKIETVQGLPSQTGWVVGGELGGWLRPYTFANFFVRYAGGLGVYGDLSAPVAVNANNSSQAARELVVALSANYETRFFGTMIGTFYRSYTDPNQIQFNPNDYHEGIVDVRPQFYITEHFHAAVELSYQQRQYGGLDPLPQDGAFRQLTPKVFRASLLPILSPNGRGTYLRPIIYGVITWSHLNDDALANLFENPGESPSGMAPNAFTDFRRYNSDVLYLGLGAEWWFQSSYR